MAATDRLVAMTQVGRCRLCSARGLAASGVVALLLVNAPLQAQTRFPEESELGQAPEQAETLGGCRVELPGGQDRDSGLSGAYVKARQGKSVLFAPSLTLRETLSDNVTLSSDDEEADLITALVPAFSYCQNTSWLTASFGYQAELFHYADDSSRNDVFHQARASATATLVRNRLFLDVNGQFDQQPETFDGALSQDNELITGNRTDALNFSVSPRFVQELGPLGTSITRYSFQTSQFDDSDRDTIRHSGSFQVTSPQSADPISWVGSVSSSRVEREDDDTDLFDNAFLELGYRLTGRLQVIGRGGLETINRRDGSTDRFEGEYWEAGFRWSDAKTRIEARYGDRFFGNTVTASVERDSGPLTLRVSYDEEQTVSQSGFNITDEQEEVFRELFGEIPEAEVVIEERLDASAAYETGLSTFRVTGFQETELSRTSDDERKRTGVDALWRWRFMPRTTLTPRATWQQVDDRGSDESEEYGLRLSLARKMTPNMQAGVTVRHQERDGEGDDEFVENALLLEITRLF